jgi:hypothetical protein
MIVNSSKGIVFSTRPSDNHMMLWESMLSVPRLHTGRVECSGVSWLVSEWVRRLLLSTPSERLLLEDGSRGTGIVWEPRIRGTSAVGSSYQTTIGEDTADWDLMRALVNYRVCAFAIALYSLLLLITMYKFSINPITNPNPVYSHTP